MKYVGNRTDLGRTTPEETPKRTGRPQNLTGKQKGPGSLTRTRDGLSNIKRFVIEVLQEIRDEAIPLLIVEFNSEFERK